MFYYIKIVLGFKSSGIFELSLKLVQRIMLKRTMLYIHCDYSSWLLEATGTYKVSFFFLYYYFATFNHPNFLGRVRTNQVYIFFYRLDRLQYISISQRMFYYIPKKLLHYFSNSIYRNDLNNFFIYLYFIIMFT